MYVTLKIKTKAEGKMYLIIGMTENTLIVIPHRLDFDIRWA